MGRNKKISDYDEFLSSDEVEVISYYLPKQMEEQ